MQAPIRISICSAQTSGLRRAPVRGPGACGQWHSSALCSRSVRKRTLRTGFLFQRLRFLGTKHCCVCVREAPASVREASASVAPSCTFCSAEACVWHRLALNVLRVTRMRALRFSILVTVLAFGASLCIQRISLSLFRKTCAQNPAASFTQIETCSGRA